MSLLEEQMAERRSRILAAARSLISAGGFDGLTMRQLADQARVSVPTVYNLIGNKFLLLEALVKEQFAEALAAFAKLPGNLPMMEYIERMPGVAHDVLLANPGYTRALIHIFMTSEESSPARRVLDAQSKTLMAETVRAAQRKGELCAWADPELVAQAMYAIYCHALIGWGSGEMEEEELRAFTSHGMGLVLLSISEGAARSRLEAKLRALHESARQSVAAPKEGV
jgi:AcrR family transcriptional regulator